MESRDYSYSKPFTFTTRLNYQQSAKPFSLGKTMDETSRRAAERGNSLPGTDLAANNTVKENPVLTL